MLNAKLYYHSFFILSTVFSNFFIKFSNFFIKIQYFIKFGNISALIINIWLYSLECFSNLTYNKNNVNSFSKLFYKFFKIFHFSLKCLNFQQIFYVFWCFIDQLNYQKLFFIIIETKVQKNLANYVLDLISFN